MSAPYTFPGNCKISPNLKSLCYFRKINPTKPFNYGSGTVERNSPEAWLAYMKTRLNVLKTKAKYAGKREVYRRIGKKKYESEILKIFGRL